MMVAKYIPEGILFLDTSFKPSPDRLCMICPVIVAIVIVQGSDKFTVNLSVVGLGKMISSIVGFPGIGRSN